MKKSQNDFSFRGTKFFLFVVLCYAILSFIDIKSATASLQKSLQVLEILLPIFVIVIILMAIIGYFFQEKNFFSSLSKQKGVKGWLVALVAGLLSHGPMYAWYPMLEDLRKKGVLDGYIATFFYARAVKLPLLPLMVDYFGLKFTAVLTLYIVIASIIQGWLVEVFESYFSAS